MEFMDGDSVEVFLTDGPVTVAEFDSYNETATKYNGAKGRVIGRINDRVVRIAVDSLHHSNETDSFYMDTVYLKPYQAPPGPKSNVDVVNSPNHYTAGGIETIDYLRAKLSPEGFQGYCAGNVLKYVSRYELKNGLEDLKKASKYLEWLIESVEGATHDNAAK